MFQLSGFYCRCDLNPRLPGLFGNVSRKHHVTHEDPTNRGFSCLGTGKECRILMLAWSLGLLVRPQLWSHILNIATISCTSTMPPNDVGNPLGQHSGFKPSKKKANIFGD